MSDTTNIYSKMIEHRAKQISRMPGHSRFLSPATSSTQGRNIFLPDVSNMTDTSSVSDILARHQKDEYLKEEGLSNWQRAIMSTFDIGAQKFLNNLVYAEGALRYMMSNTDKTIDNLLFGDRSVRLSDTWMAEIFNLDKRWENRFLEAAREKSRQLELEKQDKYGITVADPSDAFDWDDPAWYWSTLQSIGESSMEFGPAAAVGGGIVSGARFAVPRVAGYLFRSKSLQSALTQQTLSVSTKVGRLSVNTGTLAQGIGTGAITNWVEGESMATMVYDDVIKWHQENPSELTEEEVKTAAARAANKFKAYNRIFMLTDALAVSNLFGQKGLTRNLRDYVGIKGFKESLSNLGKLSGKNPLIKATKAGLAEGAEEIGQGLFENYQKDAVTVMNDDSPWTSFNWVDKSLEYLKDPKLWYEGFVGFFGGGPQAITAKAFASAKGLPSLVDGKKGDHWSRWNEEVDAQRQFIAESKALLEGQLGRDLLGNSLVMKAIENGDIELSQIIGDSSFAGHVKSHLAKGSIEALEKQLYQIANDPKYREEHGMNQTHAENAQQMVKDLRRLEKIWDKYKVYAIDEKHREELYDSHVLEETTGKLKDAFLKKAQANNQDLVTDINKIFAPIMNKIQAARKVLPGNANPFVQQAEIEKKLPEGVSLLYKVGDRVKSSDKPSIKKTNDRRTNKNAPGVEVITKILTPGTKGKNQYVAGEYESTIFDSAQEANKWQRKTKANRSFDATTDAVNADTTLEQPLSSKSIVTAEKANVLDNGIKNIVRKELEAQGVPTEMIDELLPRSPLDNEVNDEVTDYYLNQLDEQHTDTMANEIISSDAFERTKDNLLMADKYREEQQKQGELNAKLKSRDERKKRKSDNKKAKAAAKKLNKALKSHENNKKVAKTLETAKDVKNDKKAEPTTTQTKKAKVQAAQAASSTAPASTTPPSNNLPEQLQKDLDVLNNMLSNKTFVAADLPNLLQIFNRLEGALTVEFINKHNPLPVIQAMDRVATAIVNLEGDIITNAEESTFPDSLSALNQIASNQQIVQESEDGTSYIVYETSAKEKGTEMATLPRVSSESSLKKPSKDKDSPALKMGEKIDALFRDVITGDVQSMETYNLTDDADTFAHAIKQMQAFVVALAERGETPLLFKDASGKLSTEVTLFSEIAGLAGTIDLITVDKDGQVHIYDFKTTSKKKLFGSHNDVTSPEYFGGANNQDSSYYANHTRQLNLYRLLLAEQYGIVASSLAIVPIEVSYDYDTVTLDKNGVEFTGLFNTPSITNVKSLGTGHFFGSAFDFNIPIVQKVQGRTRSFVMPSTKKPEKKITTQPVKQTAQSVNNQQAAPEVDPEEDITVTSTGIIMTPEIEDVLDGIMERMAQSMPPEEVEEAVKEHKGQDAPSAFPSFLSRQADMKLTMDLFEMLNTLTDVIKKQKGDNYRPTFAEVMEMLAYTSAGKYTIEMAQFNTIKGAYLIANKNSSDLVDNLPNFQEWYDKFIEFRSAANSEDIITHKSVEDLSEYLYQTLGADQESAPTKNPSASISRNDRKFKRVTALGNRQGNNVVTEEDQLNIDDQSKSNATHPIVFDVTKLPPGAPLKVVVPAVTSNTEVRFDERTMGSWDSIPDDYKRMNDSKIPYVNFQFIIDRDGLDSPSVTENYPVMFQTQESTPKNLGYLHKPGFIEENKVSPNLKEGQTPQEAVEEERSKLRTVRKTIIDEVVKTNGTNTESEFRPGTVKVSERYPGRPIARRGKGKYYPADRLEDPQVVIAVGFEEAEDAAMVTGRTGTKSIKWVGKLYPIRKFKIQKGFAYALLPYFVNRKGKTPEVQYLPTPLKRDTLGEARGGVFIETIVSALDIALTSELSDNQQEVYNEIKDKYGFDLKNAGDLRKFLSMYVSLPSNKNILNVDVKSNVLRIGNRAFKLNEAFLSDESKASLFDAVKKSLVDKYLNTFADAMSSPSNNKGGPVPQISETVNDDGSVTRKVEKFADTYIDYIKRTSSTKFTGYSYEVTNDKGQKETKWTYSLNSPIVTNINEVVQVEAKISEDTAQQEQETKARETILTPEERAQIVKDNNLQKLSDVLKIAAEKYNAIYKSMLNTLAYIDSAIAIDLSEGSKVLKGETRQFIIQRIAGIAQAVADNNLDLDMTDVTQLILDYAQKVLDNEEIHPLNVVADSRADVTVLKDVAEANELADKYGLHNLNQLSFIALKALSIQLDTIAKAAKLNNLSDIQLIAFVKKATREANLTPQDIKKVVEFVKMKAEGKEDRKAIDILSTVYSNTYQYQVDKAESNVNTSKPVSSDSLKKSVDKNKVEELKKKSKRSGRSLSKRRRDRKKEIPESDDTTKSGGPTPFGELDKLSEVLHEEAQQHIDNVDIIDLHALVHNIISNIISANLYGGVKDILSVINNEYDRINDYAILLEAKVEALKQAGESALLTEYEAKLRQLDLILDEDNWIDHVEEQIFQSLNNLDGFKITSSSKVAVVSHEEANETLDEIEKEYNEAIKQEGLSLEDLQFLQDEFERKKQEIEDLRTRELEEDLDLDTQGDENQTNEEEDMDLEKKKFDSMVGEVDPKSSASPLLKLFLATIDDKSEPTGAAKDNWYGGKQKVNPQKVWSTIKELLADSWSDRDKMIEKLIEASDKHPYLRQVADILALRNNQESLSQIENEVYKKLMDDALFEPDLDHADRQQRAAEIAKQRAPKILNKKLKIANQLMVAVRSTPINMRMAITYTTINGQNHTSKLVMIDSDRNKVKQKVKDAWLVDLKRAVIPIRDESGFLVDVPLFVTKDGKTVVNKDSVTGKPYIDLYFDSFRQERNKDWNAFFRMLEGLGIRMPDEYVLPKLDSPNSTIYFNGTTKNAEEMFSLFFETQPSFSKDTSIEESNPLNDNYIDFFAGVATNFDTGLRPEGFTAGGKQMYNYTTTQFNSDRLKELQENEKVIDDLMETSFSRGSFWLRQSYVFNNDEIDRDPLGNPKKTELGLNDMKFFTVSIEALKDYGFNVPQGSLDKRDDVAHERYKLALFMKGLSGTRPIDTSGNNIVIRAMDVMYPTHSNKKRLTGFQNATGIVTQFVGDTTELRENVVDLLFKQLVEPEIKRIIEIQNSPENSRIKTYGVAGRVFHLIPALNNVKELFNEDGTLKNEVLDAANHPELLTLIHDEIKSAVKSAGEKKRAFWKRAGIGETTQETSKSGNSYTKHMQYLDENYMKAVHGVGVETEQEQLELAIERAAIDMEVNSMLANANMYMLFIGDPAQYYKPDLTDGIYNLSDEKDFADQFHDDNTIDPLGQLSPEEKLRQANLMRINFVKDTFNNMGKRLAADIAPGWEQADTRTSPDINYMFIADVGTESEPEFLNLLKELGWSNKQIGDYKKIKGADAQEWTHWSEHLNNLLSMGMIDPDVYDRIYTKLENGEDLKHDELVAVFQPTKPVYVNNRVVSTHGGAHKAMIRTYIKSSAFPLIPQVTRTHEIHKLTTFLEDRYKNGQPIQRVVMMSGTKVGGAAEAVNLMNSDKTWNNIEDTNFNESHHVVTVPRQGFKFQQSIPYKDKDMINRVSQAAKLKLVDMLDINDFKLNSRIMLTSEEKQYLADMAAKWDPTPIDDNNSITKLLGRTDDYLTGHELNKIYNTIHLTLYEQAKFNFIKRFKNKDGSWKKDVLKEEIIKEAIARKYPPSIIDAMKMVDDISILRYTPYALQFQALFNSFVNNNIIKTQLPGRSYVLGSQEGWNRLRLQEGLTEEDKESDIIWTANYNGERLLPMRYEHESEYPESERAGLKTDSEGYVLDRDNRRKMRGDQVIVAPRIAIETEVNERGEPLTRDEVALNPNRKYRKKTVMINLREKKNDKWVWLIEDEKTKRLTLNPNKFSKQALQMFGMRIPNQGPNSTSLIEIAGFLPENSGDLIIAPRDYTVRMGSDFDIDKLYTYQYHLSVRDDGKIVPYRGNNTKKKLQNTMINIHMSISENPNPEVQDKIVTPLGEGNLKEVGNDILSLREKRFGISEVFSGITSEYQREKYSNARAGQIGVGIFSQDSVFNAVIQGFEIDVELHLPKTIDTIREQFGFRKDEEGNILMKNNAPVPVVSNSLSSANTVHVNQYVHKSFVISAWQSAAVDDEALQVLYKLNANKFTMPVIRYMNQIGFINETPYFITQDVIFDYTELLKFGKTKLEAEKIILEKYNVSLPNDKKELREFKEKMKILADQQGVDELREMIEKGNEYANFEQIQAALFLKFLDFVQKGELIGALQKKLGRDTKNVGKNLIETKDLLTDEDKIWGLKIKNEQQLLESTIPGWVYTNALPIAQQFNDIFQTDAPILKSTFDFINNSVKREMRTDIQEKVYKDIISYVYADSAIGLYDGSVNDERKRLLEDKMLDDDTIINTMIEERLIMLKNSSLPDVNFALSDDMLISDQFIYNEKTNTVLVNALYGKKGVLAVLNQLISYIELNDAKISDQTLAQVDSEIKTRKDELFTTSNMPLASIVRALKGHPRVKNNPFLAALTPKEEVGGISTIEFNASMGSFLNESIYYQAFLNLFVSPNQASLGKFNGIEYTPAKLGFELVKYALLTGGQQGAIQFSKYLPPQVLYNLPTKLGISVGEYLTKSSFYDSAQFRNYKYQFLQHHADELFNFKPAQIGIANQGLGPNTIRRDDIPFEKLKILSTDGVAFIPGAFTVDLPNSRKALYIYDNIETYYKVDVLDEGQIKQYDPNRMFNRAMKNSVQGHTYFNIVEEDNIGASILALIPADSTTTDQIQLDSIVNTRFLNDSLNDSEETSVENIARTIMNKTNDEYMRLLMSTFLSMNKDERFTYATNKPIKHKGIVYDSYYFNGEIVVGKDDVEGLAEINYMSDSEAFSLIFAHELTHAHTITYIAKNYQSAEVQELVKICNEFLDIVEEHVDPTDDRILTIPNMVAYLQYIKRTPPEKRNTNSEEYKKILNEFVADVMSNKEFQRLLTQIKYDKNQSFYEKIIDQFVFLLRKMMQALKIEDYEGTLLEAAMLSTLNVSLLQSEESIIFRNNDPLSFPSSRKKPTMTYQLGTEYYEFEIENGEIVGYKRGPRRHQLEAPMTYKGERLKLKAQEEYAKVKKGGRLISDTLNSTPITTPLPDKTEGSIFANLVDSPNLVFGEDMEISHVLKEDGTRDERFDKHMEQHGDPEDALQAYVKELANEDPVIKAHSDHINIIEDIFGFNMMHNPNVTDVDFTPLFESFDRRRRHIERNKNRLIKAYEKETDPIKRVSLRDELYKNDKYLDKIYGVHMANMKLDTASPLDVDTLWDADKAKLEEIFNSPNPRLHELQLAKEIIMLWEQIGNLGEDNDKYRIFSDEINELVLDKTAVSSSVSPAVSSTISRMIGDINTELIKYRQALREANKSQLEISTKEMFGEIIAEKFGADPDADMLVTSDFKHPNIWARWVYDISDSDNPLFQMLFEKQKYAIAKAKDKANEEIERVDEQLNNLRKWGATNGKSLAEIFDMFRQRFKVPVKDDQGNIIKYDQDQQTGHLIEVSTFEWSDKLSFLNKISNKARDNAKIEQRENNRFRLAQTDKESNGWDIDNTFVVTANTNENFFVYDIVKAKTPEEIAAAKELLKELKEDAAELRKQFEEDRTIEVQYLEEMGNPYTGDPLTKAQIDQLMKLWDYANDPDNHEYIVTYGRYEANIKYDIKNVLKNFPLAKVPAISSKYSIVVPSKAEDFDSNFLDIYKPGNEAIREAYNFASDLLTKLNSFLPKYKTEYLRHNALPYITDTDLLKFNFTTLRNTRDKVIKVLRRDNKEEDREKKGTLRDPKGNVVDEIQVKYLKGNREVADHISLKVSKWVSSTKLVRGTEEYKAEKKRVVERAKREKMNEIAQSQSFDLGQVLKAYALFAMNYKYKSEMEDLVHATKSFLEVLPKLDRHGIPLLNGTWYRSDIRDHFETFAKNFFNYGLKKDFNAEVAAKFKLFGKQFGFNFSLTPDEIKERQELDDVKKSLEEKVKELRVQLKSPTLTKAESDALAAEIISLEKRIERLGDIRIRIGGKTSLTATTDQLIKYTRLLGMAFNIGAAPANLVHGLITMFGTANAGRVYNIAHLAKAMIISLSSVLKSWTLNFKYTTLPVAKKLRNMMEQLEVLKESKYEIYNKSQEVTRRRGLKKLLNIFDPYNIQARTEYFIQSTQAVAIALATKVTLADGTVTNFWKALDKNTRLPEGATIHSRNGKDITVKKNKQGDIVDFYAKFEVKKDIDEFIRDDQGNYDPDASPGYKGVIWGRVMGTFNGWLGKAVQQHMGAKRRMFSSGMVKKGMFLTALNPGLLFQFATGVPVPFLVPSFKMDEKTIKDNSKLKRTINMNAEMLHSTITLPVNFILGALTGRKWKFLKPLEEKGFTELDAANVRKQIGYIQMMLLMYALASFFRGQADDEKEVREYAQRKLRKKHYSPNANDLRTWDEAIFNLAGNTSLRMYEDLSMYGQFPGMMKTVKGLPFAGVGAAEKIFYFGQAVNTQLWDEEDEKTFRGGPFAGQNKLLKRAMDLTPGFAAYNSLLSKSRTPVKDNEVYTPF